MDITYKENTNWISLVFPWLPFLVMYSIGKWSIYDVITIIAVIYCLIKTKGKINVSYNKEYLYFILVITFLDFVALLRHPENGSWLNNYMFCTLLIGAAIILFPEVINETAFFKSYCLAGGVALAGLYYQAFQVYFLHKAVSSIIIFPSLVKSYDQINMFGLMRPMSFFSEPQAYISFMIPLYILLLSKNRIVYAVLIAVSFLLSTSTTGIVVVAIITLIWGIKYIKSTKYKIMFIAAFGLGLYAFFKVDIFEFALGKLSSVDVTNNVRLTNGFEMFNTLSFSDKLIGIGGGDIAYYWQISMSNAIYANSFAKTLIEYGYFGTIALVLVLLKKFLIKDEIVKLLVVYIAVVMFSQTIMFNAWQLFTFVIMYIYIKKNTYEMEDN